MPINVDHYEELAGEVLKVYEQAEMTMMRRVANRLNRGVTQPGWTEKKYGEMREVKRQMTDYVAALSEKRGEMQQQYIKQAYEDARLAMISDAQTFTNMSGIQGLTPNTVKVVNIMSELNSSMDAADRYILRKVNDEYAGIVGRVSALVATGSITCRDAVQRELNEFANRGITSFVDKAGRSWDMETYAEMATLTAIERATREGYLDAMQEFDYDLAQISDHYGACPICEAWQGVVVSISGTARGYPSLTEAENAGVFHPRCMHDIAVYHEGLSPKGRKTPREVRELSPGYSARSQQRYYERMERAWKRRMEVAGTPQEERAAYAHVRMYQDRIRELVGEYNAITPSEYDYLPRKYYREGGRVRLSADAKALKPVQIPTAQQAAHPTVYSAMGESKRFEAGVNTVVGQIFDKHNLTLYQQTRDDIFTFYSNAIRTNGIRLTTDENGLITNVKINRKTYNALDELSKKLAERSVEVDQELTKIYADLNSMFRYKPIYMSKYDRQDIPDFNAYAKSRENHVKITSDQRATSVDQLYEQLSEKYPNYFPSDVYAPSDRLYAINYAMDGIRDSKTVTVREAYGEEGVRITAEEIFTDLNKGYAEAYLHAERYWNRGSKK